MAKKNHKPLKCIECGATRSNSKKPFTIDSLRDHMADAHGLGGDKFSLVTTYPPCDNFSEQEADNGSSPQSIPA